MNRKLATSCARGFLGQERGVWIMKNWDDMTPLEEIYAIRREIAEENGYDLNRIFEAARESQRQSEAAGVKFIRLPIIRQRHVKEK